MLNRIWTDRSRVEQFQRCNRSRFLEYHQNGTGIVKSKKSLALGVGGSVHEGLADLLRGRTEDEAVATALADFAQYQGKLELDGTELAALQAPVAIPDDQFRRQLADSLGMSVEDAGMAVLQSDPGAKMREFDEWLFAEQSALVEGMVRAWARRRLKPLLDQYEVLEVEREGEWQLSNWAPGELAADGTDLMFMSRPDALLRDRATNDLYIQSFKTAASWDYRKERDAQHDMQGLSEGVEIERRLGEWWSAIQGETVKDSLLLVGNEQVSDAMNSYLHSCFAPPRILGIRYEFLLKGDRWKDKELSARFGFECRSQRSLLTRKYVATSVPARGTAAFSRGDVCCSWEYLRDDGTEGKLAWQNWDARPSWEDGIGGWIDALDSATETMSAYDSTTGMEPRSLGWKSSAQALGFTAQHPLDGLFIPPITVYRQDDDLRDWLEQTEAQERGIAEAVARVEATTDEDERRSLLNQHFGQSRRACSYPSECPYTALCFGGADIRRDPLTSGRYRHRVPNHPQELVTISTTKFT